MKYILTLLFCLSTSISAIAAIPFVKNFTNKEIMCQNWDIKQDSKGIIYIANRNGLVCFDGKVWQTYSANGNGIIRSLHIAPNDRIYIGSYEEFGYFERNLYGALTYTSISSQFRHKELKNKDIWSIEQDGSLIYFQTFSGYFSFDTQSKKIAFYRVNSMMQRLHKVNHKIYAIIQNELYQLKNNTLTKLPASSSPFKGAIRSILPYKGNKLLIQTENQGFWSYNDGQFTRQTDMDCKELDVSVSNEALYANNGTLLVGTRGNGLLFFTPQGTLFHKLNHQNNLPHNTVLSLFKDRTNNIWIGMEKGLALAFTDESLSFHYPKESNIGSIFDVALWNNYLYIASNQGLWKVKEEEFSTPGQPFTPQQVNIPDGFVQKLQKTDEGLIIGHGRSTYLLDKHDQITEINQVGGAQASITVNNPQQKTLLLGNYNSLRLYDIKPNGSYTFRHKLNDFNGYPQYMEFDNNGNLWVAHARKGIYKLKMNRKREQLTGSEFIPCLGDSNHNQIGVFNIDGRIVFTDEQQFYTYNDLSDSIIPYKRFNDHLAFIAHTKRIVKVDNTYYWFITDMGVALVNLTSKVPVIEKVLLFDKYNLRMYKGFENIVPISRDYSVLCAENALVTIPHKPEAGHNPVQQEIVFTAITAYNILKEEKQNLPVQPNGPMLLTADFNSLNIQASYPAYNEDIYFQFKLEEDGIQKNWQEKQQFPSINIQRLPAGNYCLKCRVINEKGIAVTTTSFEFKILPPWYCMSWAYGCYLLLFGLILFIIYRRVRRKAMLQQQHIIKEREQQIIELENKRLNDEIQFKGKELTQSAMTIIENNKILLTIKEEIESHKRAMGTQYPNKYYQKLIDIIDNATSKGKEWDMFLANFDLIHEQFFRKLRQKYPQLTANDLKLCALLRLNMSTKDMADMLNIGVRAVETARYRLRKKMDLDSTIDLVQFLIDF